MDTASPSDPVTLNDWIINIPPLTIHVKKEKISVG
jgi:hypothetical protein